MSKIDQSRTRITSGAPWEDRVAYRRAIKVGQHVFVSGTVAIDEDGAPFAVGDVGAQASRCLEIIKAALAEAGASTSDVVRTRMYVLDMSSETQSAVGAAHHKVFRDCPPASTMVAVRALAHPDFLIEIEAEAII